MAKTVEVQSYWPEVLSSLKEFQAIAMAENPELTDLWTDIGNAFNDQYVNDATEDGVKRYESILKIVPKATETLNERKFKILTRYNEQLPYTYKALQERLDTLCGPDGYTVELNLPVYEVKVRVRLSAQSSFNAVDDLLDNIVPMNMIIDLDLLYNKHSQLAAYTHAELSVYTHDQLRKEVI